MEAMLELFGRASFSSRRVSTLMSARACLTMPGMAVTALRSTDLSFMEKPDSCLLRSIKSENGPSTRFPMASSIVRAAVMSFPYAVWSRRNVHCGLSSSSRSARVDVTISRADVPMLPPPPQPSAVLARFSEAEMKRFASVYSLSAEIP